MALASSRIFARLRRALVGFGYIVRTSATSTVSSDPSITSGAGAPSDAEPNGSLRLRTDGSAATTLYARVAGAWQALVTSSGPDFGVSGLKSDSLAESTSAAGVTVDGLLIKDGDVRVGDSDELTFGADQDVKATHNGTDSVRVTNAAAGVMDFDDDVFQVVDPVAPTKKGRIDAGNVTAGQTRVVALADRDVDLDPVVLKSAVVTVTAAQLRALRATPKTLIAAPGATKWIEFVSSHLWLDFGTVAHDAPVNAGDDLGFRYTDGSGSLVATQEATGLVNGASDQHRVRYAAAGGSASDLNVGANQALVLHNIGAAEYAGTGDSPLKVEVLYRVRTFEPA